MISRPCNRKNDITIVALPKDVTKIITVLFATFLRLHDAFHSLPGLRNVQVITTTYPRRLDTSRASDTEKFMVICS